MDSAPGYLKVEAVYAATAEGALHLDDILARRTRISIETWDRGLAAADEVAALVAPVLGWDAAAIEREVAALPQPGRTPSGSRSPSPTTCPPTPPGSVRRTSGWAAGTSLTRCR